MRFDLATVLRDPVNPHIMRSGLLDFRADRGITLHTIPRAGGTTPPILTLSGNLNKAIGLFFQIDSVAGGTGLGQATFRYSVDNGSNNIATGVLTGASVPLSGAASGITASWAAGPYNVNNTYDPLVATWTDQLYGIAASQATAAAMPLYIASSATLGNRPVLRGTAAQNWSLDNTTYTGLAQAATRTMFAAARASAGDVGGTIFEFKRGSPDFCFQWFKTAGLVFVMSDSATNITIATPPTMASTSYYLTWVDPGTGVLPTFRANGTAFTCSANVPAEPAGNGFAIGNRTQFGQAFDGDIGRIMLARSVINVAGVERYLKRWFGL